MMEPERKSERARKLPLREFHDVVDEIATRLSNIIHIDPNEVEDESLGELVSDTKSEYRNYIEHSKALSARYIAHGSSTLAKAEQVRRRTLHNECFEAIDIINMCRTQNGVEERSNIGDMSFLSVEKHPLETRRLSPTLLPNPFNFNVPNNREFVRPSVIQRDTQSHVRPLSPVLPPRSELNDAAGGISSESDYLTLDREPSGRSTPLVVDSNTNVKYYDRNYKASKVTPKQEDLIEPTNDGYRSDHTSNRNLYTSSAFRPIHTDNPRPTNDDYRSTQRHVPSTVGRHPENLYQTHSYQPPSHPSNSDNYLRKMELFRPTLAPFSGEPHRFHAWLSLIENELKEVHLNSIEKIKVLMANTKGEPLKLIEDLFYAGASNPDRALNNIWRCLQSQFGSDMQVSSSLITKIREFPNIKYMSQGKKVRELLHLCQLIDSYKDGCNELKYFDLASGLLEIWPKLPDPIQHKWKSFGNRYEKQHYGTTPSLSVFIEFLEENVDEMCNPNYQKVWTSEPPRQRAQTNVMRTDVEAVITPQVTRDSSSTQSFNCPLHQTNQHKLIDCYKFKSMKYDEKRKAVFENKRCFKCIEKHMLKDCTSDAKCDKCQGNHITLMHNAEYVPKKDKPDAPKEVKHNSLCTAVCDNPYASKSCSKTVLVEITLPSVSSKKLITYAILDDQSSGSFIDPSIISYFNAPSTPKDYSLRTLHGLSTRTEGHVVEDLIIKGIGCDKSYKLPPMVTNESIPDTKNEVASPQVVRSHPHVAGMAEYFNEIDDTAQVLLLIGRNCSPTLPVVCYGDQAPYVFKTNLGYALVGDSCVSTQENVCLKTTVIDHEHFSTETPMINNSIVLPKLPLTEDIFDERQDDELKGYSADEENFIKQMENGVHINKEGHITLPLPFKDLNPCLPNNRQAILCRSINILNRLKKDPNKLGICIESMQKNLNANFVEPVPDEDLQTTPGKAYWLSIFPVSHPKKKLRLVFDSAAKYKGKCLNDYLLKGPDENNRLKGVLLRFRRGPVGFSSDVEAMFSQFHVTPEDSDYLRFYWFKNNNPEEVLVEHRARVHIFGNKPSPAVANFGIKYATTIPSSNSNVEAKQFISDHVYVDDGLCSTDDAESAVKIIKSTRETLEKVGVRLCKIMSNSSEVMSSFPDSEIAKPTSLVEFNGSTYHGALGVMWNTESDQFVLAPSIKDKPFTRRGIVSTINSLYDPLGLISPVLLTGRILQRSILNFPDKDLKDIWDQELPDTYRNEWDAWVQDLSNLNKFSIPRSFIPKNFGKIERQEIHTFADASFHAVSCVSYLRSISENGNIHVSFICSNSKLAPKGTTSIPRLELCSALEAALTTYEIVTELKSDVTVTLYSDSTVTLGYLNNTCKRFSKYVSRRISLIKKCFPSSCWQYVPTEVNPADIATRPITVDDMLNTRWTEGPKFLDSPDIVPFSYNGPDSLPEQITTEKTLHTNIDQKGGLFDELVKRVNVWNKLQRIALLVVKACGKFLSKIRSNDDQLVESTQNAQKVLVKDSQQIHFSKLLNELQNKQTPSDKKIQQWAPFLDENGLIRVGGRCTNAPFSFEEKHPLLIPFDHPLSYIIANHFHVKSKHQGRLVTSGVLKSSGYFIQYASKLIKKMINSCYVCRKLRAPTEYQRMSDLPEDRLTKTPPFTIAGIDMCGPFDVKNAATTRRNAGTCKQWILLITCMYSRATHSEVLPSLDTNSFINAYRRFVSLRGPCRKLKSDCGSNFVSARNIENKFSFDSFKDELGQHETEWELIPPHASHFGGIWERKVGTLKRIMNATLAQLGNRHLNHDDFVTLVAESTAIMNNTPLSEITYDPNEPLPLTPALLLTDKTNSVQPPLGEFSSKDILAYGKNRYKRVQHLANYFWQRWKDEYIQHLNKRKKWSNENDPLKVDDVVLVKEKNVKRNKWNIARVVELIQSKDGRIRSVIVKMMTEKNVARYYERPVVDIVLLLP